MDALTQPRMRLRVRLRLLTTTEGGRELPIWSGYRPDWDMGDRLEDGGIDYRMAFIAYLAKEPLSPGDQSEAEIEPYRTDAWGAVRPGDQLTCFEGHQAVGRATVLAVSSGAPSAKPGESIT